MFLEKSLQRWVDAGLLDIQIAERIRAFERDRNATSGRRWPVLLALIFGGVLTAAGTLLFVAAHWETMSPSERFLSVLAMTGVFHLAGASFPDRYRNFGITMHALGTVALGAGIYMTGQIFNMAEHWPAAIMLWAIGAGVGYALLRHWPQFALAAWLVPVWLTGEWYERAARTPSDSITLEGLVLFAVAYLLSGRSSEDSTERRVLRLLGVFFVIPTLLWFSDDVSQSTSGWRQLERLAVWKEWLGRLVFYGVPAAILGRFDRKQLPAFAGLALWVLVAGVLRPSELAMYGWAAVLAIGVVFWFSNVMDKMGRATSLISIGLLFLLGGWVLERTRRELVARSAGDSA